MPKAPRIGAGFDNAGQHTFLQDCFGDSTPCLGMPMSDAEAMRSSMAGTAVAVVKKRRRKKPLTEAKLERVQYKLKAASYTIGGMDWENLFKQYDQDYSGTLEIDELKKAVRATLKLNSTELPDFEIESLFDMLDADHSETIEIDEFLVFLVAFLPFRGLCVHLGHLTSAISEWALSLLFPAFTYKTTADRRERIDLKVWSNYKPYAQK